jgi:hypothetical protein
MASRDPVIDAMRTIFWYEGLAHYLNAPTAYALERRIEPESFSENDKGMPIRRNKWSRYRRGLHRPQESLVIRANNLVPGSARDLNHVLWEALNLDLPIYEYAHTWLRQLRPELQIILFEHEGYMPIHSSRRLLGKLEHRASLDALAALTILLRVIHAGGLHDRVWDYAHRVLRMLLILGQIFVARGMADAIFHAYAERIFALAKWKGQKFVLNNYNYPDLANLLYRFASHKTRADGIRRPTWGDLVHYMRKTMDGKFGEDWQIALHPVFGPNADLGPATETDLIELKQNIRIRDRSVENVRMRGSHA